MSEIAKWVKLPPAPGSPLGYFYARSEKGFVLGKGYSNKDEPARGWKTFHLADVHILALATQLPEVRALVEYHQAMEYQGDRSGAFCLACGATPKEGHYDECRWYAALAPFKGGSDD